jgi:sulfide:quinone oxidoreductase
MTRVVPFRALIAGGGPAAIEAALALRELAPDVDVDLITAEAEFVYRPMSVVEPFARPGARRYELAGLADSGVTVHHGTLAGVDAPAHVAVAGDGAQLPYDALLVAIGAEGESIVPDALSFGGPDEAEAMHGLIQDVEGGYVPSVVFVAPAGGAWTLPIYELALQTAERAREMSLDDVKVTVVSEEPRPLDIFGEAASELIEGLFAKHGIGFVSGDEVPPAARRVAIPLLRGRRIDGLPSDGAGFLPVDGHAKVDGIDGVWGAGDGTDSTIKQGGLATQQAEVAARGIAAAAGVRVEGTPFEPVLRALMIAGRDGWFLRRRLNGFDPGQVSKRALWWPPTKIAGRYLGPFLERLDAEHAVFPTPEALA